MATSEHTLKLKAVLDTSQVRQQLNSIKTQANQALSSQQQRLQQSGSAGPGIYAQLNTTLRNLQMSIDRLSQIIARQLSYKAMSSGATSQTSALSQNAGIAGAVGAAMANKLSDQTLSFKLRQIGHTNQMLKNMKSANLMSTPEYDRLWKSNVMDIISIGKLKRQRTEQQQAAQQAAQLQNMQLAKSIRRGVVAYGASDVLSTAGDVAEAAGYQKTGMHLKTAGAVLTAGTVGGVVAGPAGALIGGGIALFISGLQNLANKLKDYAEVVSQSAARIKSAQKVESQWKDFQRSRADSVASRADDIGYFKIQAAAYRAKQKSAQAQLEESAIGSADPGALLKYETQTRQLLENKTISASQAKERFAEADQWKETFSQLQKNMQLADEYESKVEQIKAANEKNLEVKRDELAVLDKQEEIQANLEKYAGDPAHLSALARRAKDQLTAAKATYRGKLSTSDVTEAGLQSLADSRIQMQRAQQEYAAYSQAAQRAQQQTQATALENTAAQLNELQNKLKSLSAPNLEQVTSLASSGLMTSQSYDQAVLQQQARAEEEQTQIQRQILQKMDEINTLSEATYS